MNLQRILINYGLRGNFEPRCDRPRRVRFFPTFGRNSHLDPAFSYPGMRPRFSSSSCSRINEYSFHRYPNVFFSLNNFSLLFPPEFPSILPNFHPKIHSCTYVFPYGTSVGLTNDKSVVNHANYDFGKIYIDL